MRISFPLSPKVACELQRTGAESQPEGTGDSARGTQSCPRARKSCILLGPALMAELEEVARTMLAWFPAPDLPTCAFCLVVGHQFTSPPILLSQPGRPVCWCTWVPTAGCRVPCRAQRQLGQEPELSFA